jgi:dolichyl-phosphate beta-glucosyltransferase
MYSFHFLLRMVGVSEIRDTQCGFKVGSPSFHLSFTHRSQLFSRTSLVNIAPTLHLQTWLFDVEVLLLASLIRPPITVVEVPIQWHEVGGSKLNVLWDSIGMARDVVVLRANYMLGRWKPSDGMRDGRNYLSLGKKQAHTNGVSK